MPLLKMRRMEMFAQNRAKGMTQMHAYVSAGYKGSDSNACSLEAKPHVKARIAEIRKETVELEEALSTAESRAEKLGYGDVYANEALFREESRKNLHIAREARNIEEANKSLEMYGVALGVLKHRSTRARIPTSNGPKRPQGRQAGTKMVEGILLSPAEVALYESKKTEHAQSSTPPPTGPDNDRADDPATPDVSVIHRFAERLRSDAGELPSSEAADPSGDERNALSDDRDGES